MVSINEARDLYSLEDPVHGFPHILRVFRLAEKIATVEGADLEIVRAAACLHDLEGDVNQRDEHHLAAAEAATRLLGEEGWPDEKIAAVTHCIRAHRFRNPQEFPRTLEAKVLFDADKLDAIGAVGIARAIAYAVRAGQPLYPLPSRRFIETGQKETGEHHSPYHEFLHKLRLIKERLFTETGKRMAESRHEAMVLFFQQWVFELEEGS